MGVKWKTRKKIILDGSRVAEVQLSIELDTIENVLKRHDRTCIGDLRKRVQFVEIRILQGQSGEVHIVFVDASFVRHPDE